MNKVLIIDDEPIIVMLIKTLLESKGYAVVSAHTGEDGIRMSEYEKPDLIILDYQLPDFNGAEVFSMLKSNPDTHEIPVVFFTANIYEEDVGQLRVMGCKIFQKPLNTREFIKEIQTLVPLNKQSQIPELA